jgi:DNA mismatch repair protein MutL
MINVLDQITIDKIAAGEVIERPSSVVKELVENSIDSGATAITIEIKDGGMSFIRITDNGSGINRDEVRTAFLRHATSKLIKVEDLLELSSLGFRGEALSSIASVGQVELITKEKDSVCGIRYQIHGGKEVSYEEIGCPDGTTIIVRNLFYNTPARKKFMKSPTTEMSYIYDLICRISMSHPEISFKFTANNTNKLFTSGNGKLKDIIYHIYGRDITSNLIDVNRKFNTLEISGYIAKPAVSRGNRSFEDYYVNNRYVKNPVITKAIEDAFRTFVMIHKFPFTVLNFKIDPAQIDVNIHPAKREMKFMNESDIYNYTYDTIREALLHRELIPEVTPGKQKPAETLNHRNTGSAPEPFEKQRREQIGIKPAAVKEAERPYNIKPIIKPENNPYARILNRVPDQPQNIPNNPVSQQAQTQQATQKSQSQPVNESTPATSALSADQENITDKDNSVNVSRITSEITVTNTQAGEGTATQTKTTAPAEVAAPQPQVPEKEKKYSQLDMFGTKMLSEEARPKHRLIGQVFKTFWLIEYDKKLFIMDQHAAHEKVKFEELMNNYRNKKAIPQYLMPPAIVTLTADEITFLNDNMEFFENLGYTIESFGGREYKLSSVPANLFGIDGRELFLEFIGELSENNKNSTITAFIAKLSTMACKAAIKGNTEISFKEADVLIDQLLKLENPYTCPHGRPTLISMTEAELEKKFKRIV